MRKTRAKNSRQSKGANGLSGIFFPCEGQVVMRYRNSMVSSSILQYSMRGKNSFRQKTDKTATKNLLRKHGYFLVSLRLTVLHALLSNL